MRPRGRLAAVHDRLLERREPAAAHDDDDDVVERVGLGLHRAPAIVLAQDRDDAGGDRRQQVAAGQRSSRAGLLSPAAGLHPSAPLSGEAREARPSAFMVTGPGPAAASALEPCRSTELARSLGARRVARSSASGSSTNSSTERAPVLVGAAQEGAHGAAGQALDGRDELRAQRSLQGVALAPDELSPPGRDEVALGAGGPVLQHADHHVLVHERPRLVAPRPVKSAISLPISFASAAWRAPPSQPLVRARHARLRLRLIGLQCVHAGRETEERPGKTAPRSIPPHPRDAD